MQKNFFEFLYLEKDLSQIGAQIVRLLEKEPYFVMWFDGELGAGKTTLCKSILSCLGLSSKVDVSSPTFTYMNEYKIGDRWYAHLDLYRLKQESSLETLGILEFDRYAGVFVEWPEKVRDCHAYLPANFIASLSFDVKIPDQRKLELTYLAPSIPR